MGAYADGRPAADSDVVAASGCGSLLDPDFCSMVEAEDALSDGELFGAICRPTRRRRLAAASSTAPAATPSSGALPVRPAERKTLDGFRGVGETWSSGPLSLASDVELPASVAEGLRPFQRAGVEWLFRRLFVEGRGCILADEMGLGKTVQVACCLAGALFCQPCEHSVVLPVLVVCPPTLCDNWAAELRRWGPFAVEILPSMLAGRQRALERLDGGLVDVLVASRGLLRSAAARGGPGAWRTRAWSCVVIDELHEAKNASGQLHQALCELSSPRKLGITGTPLQNSLTDIWAMLRVVGAHGDMDRYTFEARFGRPITNGQRRLASVRELAVRQAALGAFRLLISDAVLRRTKEDVELQLPGKNDRVVPCPLSSIQRQAYKNLLAGADFQLCLGVRKLCLCGRGPPCICGAGPVWRHVHRRQAAEKGLEDEYAAAQSCVCRAGCPPRCLSLALITVLQRLTNHIELLKPDQGIARTPAEQEQQATMQELCDVAFEGIGHAICSSKRISNRLLLGSPEACGKMQVLLPLLRHWRQKGEKVLVFSGSTRLLDVLEACLWQQGWSPQVLRLDGATVPSQRQRLVDEFKTSSSRGIFLISTRAGGVGLNLTAASVVVIFDPDWNPFSDLQAQDRSFRIGQKRVVEVYRLLGAGSIEEQIYVRQVWKQQLAATVLDGQQGARGRLDASSFGIDELFVLRESSLLPALMADAFTTRDVMPSEETAGVQIFDDIRAGASACAKTAAPGAEAPEAVTSSSLEQPCDRRDPFQLLEPSDVSESEPTFQDDPVSLEHLHRTFDQLDHAKLMRSAVPEDVAADALALESCLAEYDATDEGGRKQSRRRGRGGGGRGRGRGRGASRGAGRGSNDTMVCDVEAGRKDGTGKKSGRGRGRGASGRCLGTSAVDAAEARSAGKAEQQSRKRPASAARKTPTMRAMRDTEAYPELGECSFA